MAFYKAQTPGGIRLFVIVIVCAARQVCKPPRAATFLSTISTADNLGAVEEVRRAAFRDRVNAIQISIATVFPNISGSSQNGMSH
jgi:hypothetical protein